jgi:OmpA-OmpF porin, OOP family
MRPLKMTYLKEFRIALIIIVLMIMQISSVFAQRWKLLRYEAGVGTGSVQLFGDIGGTASKENWFGLKDIKINETSPAFSMDVRYKINPILSTKVNLDLGFGRGQDAGSRNDRGRSYKTVLFEFSGQVEHYFLVEEKRYRSAAMYNRRGMMNNYATLSAYTFVGAGLIYAHANPNPGSQPIHEVDSYKPGSHFAPVFPFGIGVKYVIDERSYIGGELGYRWAFSDYLEGYKQTAASKHRDIYYFFLISYNYRLKTTHRNIPAILDHHYRSYGY